MKKPLLILGAGGFAKEAFSWLSHEEYQVEAFYSVKAQSGNSLFGAPMVNSLEGFAGANFLVAVGSPQDRSWLWDKAIEAGLQPCDPIIHPSAVIGRGTMIEKGAIVCPNAVITAHVTIGLGLILNLGATIGHDSLIGDFVTISPGANISGKVNVGNWAYIGTGAVVREGQSIGDAAVIGAGAVVVKDVLVGLTVAGNPARQLERKSLP